MIVLQYFGYFFLTLGTVFLFLGSLGIVRMPDLYTRIQAGTKSTTLGAMSFILGIGLLQPDWLIKLLAVIFFIAISNPLSSHALARASYKHRYKPLIKGSVDAYKDVVIPEEIKEEDKK
ncbi:MAG: Na+/H+ antiporter subunit G [Bacteroidales bacterium]|nr:Na+/H+ antiporter subunit G [Bacteroidales bacterium]